MSPSTNNPHLVLLHHKKNISVTDFVIIKFITQRWDNCLGCRLYNQCNIKSDQQNSLHDINSNCFFNNVIIIKMVCSKLLLTAQFYLFYQHRTFLLPGYHYLYTFLFKIAIFKK